MTIRLLTLVAIIAVFQSVHGQVNNWQGITPLLSTRTQVEKLLGKPVEGTYYGESDYTTEKGRYTVTYSLKTCDAGWNVYVDTVLSIKIPPTDGQADKSAKDLGLDESRFFVSGDDAFFGTWTDPDAGVQLYFRNMTESLLWIKYIPRRADNTRRCKGFPPFVPEAQYYPFETRPFNDPKAGKDGGMDNLVAGSLVNLIYQAKESKGKYKPYVLVYFDKKLPYKTYQKRLRQFRLFAGRMVKRVGQPVEIIESGVKSQNEAQFYLLPSDWKPPAPTPTLPSPQFMR